MKAIDKQVGGGHYKLYKIQPIEFIVKNNIPFIEGCIIKYALRHRYKNGIEDLKKIKHYVDLLIELEYGDEKLQRGSRWPVPEREKESLKEAFEKARGEKYEAPDCTPQQSLQEGRHYTKPETS